MKQLKEIKKVTMRKKWKMTSITIMVIAVTILTGTFAWRSIQTSITAGKGHLYDYLVKLMDESSDPFIIKNNWEAGDTLEKEVYATSSYNNSEIKSKYNTITIDKPDTVFSNTWVRIQLEETLTRNGHVDSKIVKGLEGGQVVSQFDRYFELMNSATTEIVTMSAWDGIRSGRFWILDEDTGWLYWAQPLLATTLIDVDHPELADQITDPIIDEVNLKIEPTGVWTYSVKATLDAIDVELDGYKGNEKAWNDITVTDKIYRLIAIEEDRPLKDDAGNLLIVPINFPNKIFRDWILLQPYGLDGIITEDEFNQVENINLINMQITDLTGINYFTELEVLNIEFNKPGSLDISDLTKLKELRANNCLLTNIKLPEQLPDIEILRLYTNLLVNITFPTEMPNLKELHISSNKFESLIFPSSLPSLDTLNVSGNKLTNIQLPTGLENLHTLVLSNNFLTQLVLPKESVDLSLLYISDNKLSGVLDVSDYPLLTNSYFNVKNNYLEKIILTNTNITLDAPNLKPQYYKDTDMVNNDVEIIK